MRAVLLLSLFALLGLPLRAAACFDGFSAHVGDVQITGDRAEWSPARARLLATWMTRTDALLPEGTAVSVDFGYTELCVGGTCTELDMCGGGGTCAVNARSLERLFDEVARATGANSATVAMARALETETFTVQVAAFPDRARAEALARRIESAGVASHGFYEAGGFPADNSPVHVVSATLPDGRIVHRVVVGAFSDIVALSAETSALAALLGHTPIVRRLEALT